MLRGRNWIWMWPLIVYLCQQCDLAIFFFFCQSAALMFYGSSAGLGLLMCVQCTQSCLKGPACYHCTRVQPSVRWSLGQLLITLYWATEATALNDNSVLGNNQTLSASFSSPLFVCLHHSDPVQTKMSISVSHSVYIRRSYLPTENVAVQCLDDHLERFSRPFSRFCTGRNWNYNQTKNVCMWTGLWCITSRVDCVWDVFQSFSRTRMMKWPFGIGGNALAFILNIIRLHNPTFPLYVLGAFMPVCIYSHVHVNR